MMRAGKIKGIGVSNFSVKTLTVLLKHADIVPATNRIERLHTIKIATLSDSAKERVLLPRPIPSR